MEESSMTCPIKRCTGMTQKGKMCKNIGFFKHGLDWYCNHHVPRTGTDCVICLGALYNPYVLPCGHRFHVRCIMKWTKRRNSCPVCRKTIMTNIHTTAFREELNKYNGQMFDLATDVAHQSQTLEEFCKNMIALGIV